MTELWNWRSGRDAKEEMMELNRDFASERLEDLKVIRGMGFLVIKTALVLFLLFLN